MAEKTKNALELSELAAMPQDALVSMLEPMMDEREADATLFDTHAHLDSERFDTDRDELIRSLPAEGVGYCVVPGCDPESWRAAAALADGYPHIYFSAGQHPHEAAQWSDSLLPELRELLARPKAVAVGEIGLDYHYDFSPRDVQREVFKKHLALSRELGLPVVIHCRESERDMMDILNTEAAARGGSISGVMHCFSADAQTALECVALGLHISFSGSLTFKNAGNLALAAEAVPLSRLLIETDAPYLAPEPFRGKRNDPRLVKHVLKKLAAIKDMDEQKLAAITTGNALRLFGLAGREVM